MSANARTFKATCLCGESAHEITLPESSFPLKAWMCSCDSCRHMTGSLCLSIAFLPTSYQPDQSFVKRLTSFAFSKRINVYHCPTCGCQMIAGNLNNVDDPKSGVQWDVYTGTLEQPENGILEWQGHEFIADTLDGGYSDMLTEIGGRRLHRWPGHVGKLEELPLHWQSPERPKVEPKSDDKLHGYCLCRGVEFWVSRPTKRSALSMKTWPNLPSPADVENSEIPPDHDTYWLRDKQMKYLGGLCACDSCRLASGMEPQFWAFISTMDLSLDKEGKLPFNLKFGTLKEYTSSPGTYRYFCSTCGATCFYNTDDRDWTKDVGPGLLAAPEGARAETWIAWRTNKYGYREDTVGRADILSTAIEKGLKEWEAQRGSEDLSGPAYTPGAL